MGKLRAHDSKDVSDLAKEIVKKWKNDVDKAKSKPIINGKPPGASPHVSCLPSDGRLVRKQSTSLTPVATPTLNGKAEIRNSKSDGVRITTTGDNTRDRCAELIYDGLACDSGARESLCFRPPSDSLCFQPAISSPTVRSPSKRPCMPALATRPKNTGARSAPCSSISRTRPTPACVKASSAASCPPRNSAQ